MLLVNGVFSFQLPILLLVFRNKLILHTDLEYWTSLKLLITASSFLGGHIPCNLLHV